MGISVGRLKFPLKYSPVYMREPAPFGLRELDSQEFNARYLERLDAVGIARLQKRFAEISDEHGGRGLVFCCFEPVGRFCLRHLFARWLEQQTGEPVPELHDDQLELF